MQINLQAVDCHENAIPGVETPGKSNRVLKIIL